MANISIEGMEFFSYHGCFAEEQVIGTRFIVDIVMELNVEEASINDDLKTTVDYQKVYVLVKEQMEIRSKLLENVCWRIITAVKSQFPQIDKIKVNVSKMHPPIGGKVERVSFSTQS